MVRPHIDAGIEEARQCRCIRVDPGNVRTLKPVAVRAGKREIFFDGFSAVFFRNDVVDLKWQRKGKLWNQAVFATVAGARPDPPDKFPIHCGATVTVFFRSLLALACMTPRRLPICR